MLSKMEKVEMIHTILEDVYTSSPWSKQQIQADLEKESTDYFFVYHEKEAVGFLAIEYLYGELEITNIAVKSAFQNKGFGKALLQQLVDKPEVVFLEVRASNIKGQTFYQNNGFKPVGKRPNYYHNPTEDAVIMKREENNER
ncbi:ribosomal protein S18-alanine N-acetyltransferase [Streptococcus pacificus]|uniref:[Ribosomal protein bS18]-alanine N-acetyltransferase n=1 Tax=Streptococcus pacificus TaxID=2740577 RepID=A0ABS0ZJR6_9STRE|nr:ribosomal protein S18-alanine N-acetyltransferase [Streptococcus pacificus]MBJ8326189.1 ribosomal protein S18-alanine N-acetyltransferase [Streptococcus pacificus]